MVPCPTVLALSEKYNVGTFFMFTLNFTTSQTDTIK